MRTLILCAVALWTAVAGATPPGLIVAPDGYYSVTVGPDGVPVQEKITQVMVLGTPPVTPPTPPLPPPITPVPGDPTAFTIKVTTESKKANDPVGAVILEQAYETFGLKIADGTIPPTAAAIDKALSPVLDKALEFNPKGDEPWVGFRAVVASELATRLIAHNGTMTKDQYVQFFKEVSTGLDASTLGLAIPPWLAPILEALIPIIIKLILQLLGGAG